MELVLPGDTRCDCLTDSEGNPVGIDIDNASKIMNLKELSCND